MRFMFMLFLVLFFTACGIQSESEYFLDIQSNKNGTVIIHADTDADYYIWKQISGPKVTIEDFNSDTLTINTSTLFTEEDFVFKVTALVDDSTIVVTYHVKIEPPLNSAPLTNNDTVLTQEDTPVSIDVLDNDNDIDGDILTITNLSTPAHGTVRVEDGTIRYSPESNYNGIDSFTYVANDGVLNSNVATVNISITSQNDAPISNNDTLSTQKDTPVSIDVLDNDSDIDGDTLTIKNLSTPAHGTVSIKDNKILYTPQSNYNGTDSFTYVANDGVLNSNTTTVSISISVQNDAPVALNDTASTNEDVAVSIDVLDNDSDIDGDTLTIKNLSTPAHGTLSIKDNEVLYTPESNYNGTDSFTYVANDSKLNSNVATVSITISANKPKCYKAKPSEELNNLFNTNSCVELSGTYELYDNIQINENNLTVKGGTIKIMNHNVITTINANNIKFENVIFDFSDKEFYAVNGVTSPIVINENLHDIGFKNTTFKNLLAMQRGSKTKTQQYALQVSINNVDLVVDHCLFENFRIPSNPSRFSGFVGGIFISTNGMTTPYVSGGKITVSNSIFKNMYTIRDAQFGQENADGIRSYVGAGYNVDPVGTVVEVLNTDFYNISQSSIKLGDTKAIIKGCKTYNDMSYTHNGKAYSQYAVYRSNTTHSFTVENSEAYGNIKNMIAVSGENVSLSGIRDYSEYHGGSTIQLATSKEIPANNVKISDVLVTNSWAGIYFFHASNVEVSNVRSNHELKLRMYDASDITIDDETLSRAKMYQYVDREWFQQ